MSTNPESKQLPEAPHTEIERRKPVLDQADEEQGPVAIQNTMAQDVQFLLATYSQTFAALAARQQGDTKYVAQTAMQQARQALGVAVALGVIEDETVLPDGSPLWLSPSVPKQGEVQHKNVTLGA